ncbi:hypothetical protein AVEN_243049-1 [Araneus ventricosus]|uniref:Uncharacterized protein n=1 Tax=Araneus ventricosus TaxID=182803 RepID=A0A4Y2S0P6_ARAVE|nr:hypothetical protein AVEN_243049-1 [Araneus ventricosus]
MHIIFVNLADGNLNVPERIQMLLGAEVFYELLIPGQFRVENSCLIFQNTLLVLCCSGCVACEKENRVHCVFSTNDLHYSIRKFWEFEAVETELNKNSEAVICKGHFQKNRSRDESGRYTIKMPLKEDPSCLGEYKEIALKRLNSLWKRLKRDPVYLTFYKAVLKEYEDLSHMNEVSDQESQVAYCMPHRGVYRPEKATTKFRTVFNASSPTTKGKSLNSIQCNG